MRDEEARLLACLVEGMQETRFESKQDMADALGVSVELLEDCSSYEVLNQLLHYCVRNALPMDGWLDKLVN